MDEDSQDLLAQRFEQHRAHLHRVAVRMLGSAHEADDAVQDAWLRLGRADAEDIANLGGWLTTVVARICLNRLRARRSHPEDPVGVHVPDPVVRPLDAHLGGAFAAAGAGQPEEQVLLADAVQAALLVVLDTLGPAERIAFVLHDLFDLPFDDIAPMLGRTPAATRQLASRARRRVRDLPTAPHGPDGPDAEVIAVPPVPRQDRLVVEAFFAAARGGDVDALVALLHPEVVLRADAGTARAQASGVVHGAAAVAGRALLFARPEALVQPMLVNGAAGVLVTVAGRAVSVMAFDVTGGRITSIAALVDPERLARLDLPDTTMGVGGR